MHVVFGSSHRREAFVAEVDELGQPAAARLGAPVAVDASTPRLVAALAANESLRQRWTVTLVGDHLYVDTGPLVVDGAIRRG